MGLNSMQVIVGVGEMGAGGMGVGGASGAVSPSPLFASRLPLSCAPFCSDQFPLPHHGHCRRLPGCAPEGPGPCCV